MHRGLAAKGLPIRANGYLQALGNKARQGTQAKQPLTLSHKWLFLDERETRLELATLSLGS